jgi:hypothetical protein
MTPPAVGAGAPAAIGTIGAGEGAVAAAGTVEPVGAAGAETGAGAPGAGGAVRSGSAATTDGAAPAVTGGAAGVAPAAGAEAGRGPLGDTAGVAACTGGAGAWEGSVGVAPERGGSNPSGSTYPCGSGVRRMPSWTYGGEPAPGSPTVPIASPSATPAFCATVIVPSRVSVTDQPPAVSIVTERPLSGTLPANETVPVAGARTGSPTAPAISTTRC